MDSKTNRPSDENKSIQKCGKQINLSSEKVCRQRGEVLGKSCFFSRILRTTRTSERRDKHTSSCPTWRLYSLVVVWVDAHFVLLRVEGELAQLHRPQLMVGLQVGPAPQTAVDDVREAFSVGNLQTAIQRPASRRRRAVSVSCHFLFVKTVSLKVFT